jgi:CheY-like chemotaxis protein
VASCIITRLCLHLGPPPLQALDYLLQKCTVLPDLVLLDVMMPTVSGYEVAKRIREVWPSSVLPIIMVSDGGLAERGRGAGWSLATGKKEECIHAVCAA